jgi:hypothetical protein
MRKLVGISQKIKRAWLDAVLDRLVKTTDEAELRSFLDMHLKEELPGKESRAKSVGIILRIWSGILPERAALRDRAVALLPRIPGQERIWLHWGMTALAYPFFRDTAEVVGRLLALQDDFTTAHVQGRMLTTWGDRATSKEAAQKLITTLVDWEVLRSTKMKGHFLLASKMTASTPELQLWLLDALLAASAADEIEAQQLLRLPESFPFTISVGVADLRRYEGFNIHRQGLDMDMVALRKVRVEPLKPKRMAPRPKSEPTQKEEPVPVPKAATDPPTRPKTKSLQPSLFDRLTEDVVLTEDARQKATAHSGTTQENSTDFAFSDTTSDSELLKRFDAVRDHISEALRLIRENGDRAEVERLLIAAHDSMSDFSEFQALNDFSETGLKEKHNSTPKTAPKKTTKAKTPVGNKPNQGDTTPLPTPDPSVLPGLAGMKALSVRQPHAEAIVRGIKSTDSRSSATRFRGRFLIYASLSRYGAQDEAKMMQEYGIDDVAINELPRGVLIGTIELYNSDGGEWNLRDPERLDTPVKPTRQPKPVWFTPF